MAKVLFQSDRLPSSHFRIGGQSKISRTKPICAEATRLSADSPMFYKGAGFQLGHCLA
jgi:hypothetical protein